MRRMYHKVESSESTIPIILHTKYSWGSAVPPESALIDVLYEVSYPTHRKHVFVYSWLGHHPLRVHLGDTHDGSSLKLVGVPISQANNLLGASYQLYKHIKMNKTIIHAISYSPSSRSAARTCTNRRANDVFCPLAYAAAGTVEELRQGSSEEAGVLGSPRWWCPTAITKKPRRHSCAGNTKREATRPLQRIGSLTR
ncbi:hypothetical protein EDB85DRAFT_1922083 [Lactarius pseudohatsudake]|nr:hypothetical protein EDB85DRAFT_1922083 [Lactarius pseudohatsudake]